MPTLACHGMDRLLSHLFGCQISCRGGRGCLQFLRGVRYSLVVPERGYPVC